LAVNVSTDDTAVALCDTLMLQRTQPLGKYIALKEGAMSSERAREGLQQHTTNNEEEVLGSTTCGCLGCLSTFTPDEIEEWKEEVSEIESGRRVDRTAICPHCGDALIIGSKSGHEITPSFLEAMRMR
jgi:hypothetical protein